VTGGVGYDFEAILSEPGTAANEVHESGEPNQSTWLDRRWDRLTATPGGRALWAWGGPVIVTLVSAVTRLFGLGHPKALVFDETYYVKDAWTLWKLGYSANWPANSDPSFAQGQVNSYLSDPSFVVHPPLGKWIIGLGMQLLGPENSASWRISTAVAGILAVILLMLVAKKLFGSTLLATIAGLLFAIDGNAIVMSRVALLDNFVMLFALLGFGAILLDRGWTQERLDAWVARRREAGGNLDWGPGLWWRPWLIAAGLALGLSSAVKWNGFYFLAIFAVYVLVVDIVARRKAGITLWGTGTIFNQAGVNFLLMVPIALAAHMATWASWFTNTNSYSRHWAEGVGNAWTGVLSWVPLSVQSWWHFQVNVYQYNIGEMRPHAYAANPLTWLFMVRPTSMYWASFNTGQNGCTSNYCGQSITGIANPLIWWAATAAAFYLCYRLIRYREWRVGLILIGLAAGYLPWLLYLNRTVFQFYTIAFEPFLILGLTLAIGVLLGRASDPEVRRIAGLGLVGVFLGLCVVLSIFFWPVWTGETIPMWYLRAHWWLPSWV
jgi:dolichyl-phosphate-mannose-protein mannosyltransferase